MNILPLIFLLILTLFAFTARQMQHFVNTETINRYQTLAIVEKDGHDNNHWQRILHGKQYIKTRKFNFHPFINKKDRLKDAQFNHTKTILKELIKTLYREAGFYQKLEKKRPPFVDEIIDTIIKITDEQDVLFKGRIENLASITLNDAELQEAFYHMLKGTVEDYPLSEYQMISPEHSSKSYKSLLLFLKNGSVVEGHPEQIPADQAPYELLVAIYGNPEIAKQIINKREEYSKTPELFTDFIRSLTPAHGIPKEFIATKKS